MTTELAKQIRDLIDARARPITLSEITARARTVPVSSFHPAPAHPAPAHPAPARPAPAAPARSRLRLGWAAAVAAAAVAVGSTGAITAGQLAAAGHPAGPPAARPAGPAGPAGTLLTAAQLRQVTTASRAALAHSARAYLTYLGPGPYDAFQSEDIAFSGENYSFVGSVINPAAGGRPGQVAWFAERVVNGQAYDHELDGRVWHWFHYAGPAGSQAANILDPRAMLGVLAPGERFRFAGHVTAGGLSLERLDASDLANVPGLSLLTGARAGESATALDVLVDGHGVVHQVDISLRGMTLTAAAAPGRSSAAKAPLSGQGPMPLSLAGSTNMTVTFADIGQPQVISAPRHAITVRTPWGENGHPLPPSLLLSAGVAGS